MKNTKLSKNTSKKKFKVSVTYTWEFSAEEWQDNEIHMKNVEDDIAQKVNYDAVDTFFHMNNICRPDSSYRITVSDTN